MSMGISVPDLINATFEGGGGVLILQSIRKLHHDREVKGVHWAPISFFAAWGYWNLAYYPHLGQWLSLMGSVGITLTNTFWVCQIFYYLKWPNPPKV